MTEDAEDDVNEIDPESSVDLDGPKSGYQFRRVDESSKDVAILYVFNQ